MSPKDVRDWPDRREDIFERADRIRRMIHGVTYEVFAADRMLQDAVHYNLLVIGEAAGKAPQDVQTRLFQVPWNRIKGMRNVLAHGYASIDVEVVWETAVAYVPEFVDALRADI